MGAEGNAGYVKVARAIQRTIWFSGSTAVKKGRAVCYDRTYSSSTVALATIKDGRRDSYVAAPTSTNCMDFAGVAADDYGAVTGGQLIVINEPGSVCEVEVDIETTVNVTDLTFSFDAANAGVFTFAGMSGRGSVTALSTLAVGAATGVIFNATNMANNTYANATKTLGCTGAFANAVVGDIVRVVAGTSCTRGDYVIATRNSADEVVLATAVGGATATGISCLVLDADVKPYVLAKLQDGEESGGVDFMNPLLAGTAASGTTPTAFGTTLICGGGTVLNDEYTYTLAAGTGTALKGHRKAVKMITAALAGQGCEVIAAINVPDAADLHWSAVELIGLTDFVVVQWSNGGWAWVVGNVTVATT